MTNKKPLVSFLIALYNKESYIKECIDSCLNQTYSNVEVCVVDDGSTDDSFNIVKKLYATENKVKYYSFDENKGKVAAYNKAYEMSSGNYFALVGADDVNLNNRIEVLLKNMHNKKSNLVYGNLIKTDMKLNRLCLFDGISFDINIKRILRNNFIPGGSSLFDKKIANEVFPIHYEMKFEDWWISIISILNYRVSFVKEPVALYRLNESNDNLISTDNINHIIENNKKLYKRDFFVYEYLLKYLDKNKNINSEYIKEYIQVNFIYKKNYIETSFVTRIRNLKKLKKFNFDRWYLELFLITLFGSKIDYFKKIIKTKI